MAAPTDARIAFLSARWREAVSSDTAVQTAHPLSRQEIHETRLLTYADALAEAQRVQAMRGVQQGRYEFTAPLTDETIALDLGDVISLEHSRYGLTLGGRFVIISLEPNGLDRTITFGVWGRPWPTTFRAAAAGVGNARVFEHPLPGSAAAGAATTTASMTII